MKSRSHRKDSRRGGHGPAQCQDDCSLKTHHQPFLRFPATLVPESHWSETSNFLEATQRAGLHCSTLKPGPVWLGAAATSQRFGLMHRSHFETLFTTAFKNIRLKAFCSRKRIISPPSVGHLPVTIRAIPSTGKTAETFIDSLLLYFIMFLRYVIIFNKISGNV